MCLCRSGDGQLISRDKRLVHLHRCAVRSYHRLLWKPPSINISYVLSPEAAAEPGKTAFGPGDVTSCVLQRSVVCVIWFGWERSVWITDGDGFCPRPSLRSTNVWWLRLAVVSVGWLFFMHRNTASYPTPPPVCLTSGIHLLRSLCSCVPAVWQQAGPDASCCLNVLSVFNRSRIRAEKIKTRSPWINRTAQ